MPQITYPGVYIQEVPSGVRTITSVATSITAFVDFFKEGPLNQAVEIFGMTDFQRVFGGLDDRSEGSYAVSQFFLNGGGTALVIRVAAADGTHPLSRAGVILKADASGGGAQVLEVSAASEGIWGNNLRLDVDYITTDPARLFNVTVTRYDGPGTRAKPLASERYVNLTLDSTRPRYAVKVINDGSKLVTVKEGAGASATARPAASGTISGELSGLTTADFDGMRNHAKISVTIGPAPPVDATLDRWNAGDVTSPLQLRPFLEKAIRSAPTAAPSASFAGASVDVVGTRLRILSGKGSDTYDPSELVVIADGDGGADTTATVLKLTGVPDTNVQQYQLGLDPGGDIAALKKSTVGGDGMEPTAAEIVGSQAGDPHTGLFALDYVDLFNILCIPRAAALDNTQMTLVVSNALKYCEDRRAFFVLDVPEDKHEVQEIKDWLDAHATFRHKNAAVYFPRPRIPDPMNEFRLRSVGASGTMAGIFARTDGIRGVWKAPAGIEAQLNGVAELAAKLTDAQNGALNPLGINCLRTFPIYGNIAWGGRTLEGADQIGSEWKYIPIRRLALMLEESLFRGTKWVVFEPNDEPLWAKIRLNVGAYMMSLFRQGAFQGTSPKEAFFVKCDAETTTEDDRNKGIVNILVGFAPLKPAEFVVISIQQIAGEL
jgi:phage tail sheath protein FI